MNGLYKSAIEEIKNLIEHHDRSHMSADQEDGFDEGLITLRGILTRADKLSVSISDEGNPESKPIELIVRKGVYGLWVEKPDEEDERGALFDYFDGKLTIKVWDDIEEEDFTHNISI